MAALAEACRCFQIEDFLRRGAGQGPAALHHRGQRGRRQIHADRPSALRFAKRLRRSAQGRDQSLGEPVGRRHRFFAAHRRPARRARAGHHHRRRLSLLRDGAAQVHHRRHAGPRAVHAQHGHRRIHGRSGRDPDRRAQRRFAAIAPACLHRVAAGHSATSWSR